MGGSAKYKTAKQAKNEQTIPQRRRLVGRNMQNKNHSKQNPYNIDRGIINRTLNRNYDDNHELIKNMMTKDKQLTHMKSYKEMMKDEPKITKDVQSIANMINAPLLGIDKRRKSIKSATEKYNRLLLENKNTDMEMNDTVRFTNEVNIKTFGRDVNRALNAYKQAGYDVTKVKNFWTKPWSYKGINVTLKNKSGKLFEVQFHTKNSFQIKDGPMHKLYESQRKYKEGTAEYDAIEKKMMELANKIKIPSGVYDIKNINWD